MKYNGILEDNRSKKEQAKNYDARELDLGEVKWLTKKQAQKNADKYIFRNQYSKSSCVPSSMCNALWNTESLVLADEYLYTQRVNKPNEGCYWYDIANLVVNQGTCERTQLPEVKTEKEANAIKVTESQKLNAKKQKQQSYLFFEDPTIDQLQKWVNTGYAVPFSFFGTSKEWSKEFPVVLDPLLTQPKATINHAICAIPNTAYIEKGKKFIIITDSAHFGGKHTRHLSEDFIDVRAKHGVVFTDLSTEINQLRHKGYVFTKDLSVGSTGIEVQILQETLQDLGFFPEGFTCTQYFGGITRQAVKDFQKEYEESILWKVGLKLPTGYFGSSSRAKLTSILA